MQSSQFMRQVILKVAGSASFSGFAHRYGRFLGARRFYAGDTLDEAIGVVRKLNSENICVTLDHLGESVTTAEDAASQANVYVDILHAINEAKVDANVSIKLTQMGLDVGREECLANMLRIVAAAQETDNFIRIDMEDSQHTDATLAMVHELRKTYPRIGTVLQAYLYRSQNDLALLAAAGVTVRIVKGAYLEPSSVAFPLKSDVDQNYLRLVDMALRAGQYVAIATHDENIIQEVEGWVRERRIPLDRFEFQMLYGIRMARQRELAQQGYRVRCYVPYGTDWYAYYTRRLAERPANVFFILRSLVRS
ncbi:MAG: proline dehydrogenase family protein [Thermaerobacter sp.]|nr:proline dehydrogenase family protein [Thermaerobacter sp.]